MSNLNSFKAYDVRGRIPDEINESLAYDIGRAYAGFVKPHRVAVGYDIRLSSPQLAAALKRGLMDTGVDVLDIGLWGTEGAYFATFADKLDGGIMITASHNPPDYNGMKFVREEARPISADTGLQDMRRLIESGQLPPRAAQPGTQRRLDVRAAYLEHLLGYVEGVPLRELKVVVNPGNGGAGLIIDALEPHLPFEFVKINHQPDGTFPNGVPNPMLEENRAATADVVRRTGADLGLAWDGDYDRCFFFDESGQFIEGYYLVGLLAETFLKQEPGARIVHDPRLTWNTLDVVRRCGGTPVLCKSGHAFIKQKMREVDAVYGGEMSAHHYFRRFAYCDSGMIPWLVVLAVMSERAVPLSALVGERMRLFPASGEINRHLSTDTRSILARVRGHYQTRAQAVDLTDGLSMEFEAWRFNLRGSNTEPLVRLNVESRGDEALMREKTAELLQLIDAGG
ncbi:MAG TPA: phosphomannomutase CpsG [Steroidobacteraceae bacterium]|jgi:phosphomannomutase/phosphomannomutase/phosphoglucomutase|nr:phosphomannomutase CpsG [Steroidobacteraceae bacterium]